MRMWRVVTAAAAGAASLAASVVILVADVPYGEGETPWALAEVAGLMLLAFLAVRVAPAGWPFCAALLPAVAVPMWLLRFGWGPVTAEVVGGYVAWTLAPLTMVAFGLYLRGLDKMRVRSVVGARREQRLQLASDLHDFVAHDVSGMLAQAQAGQLLAVRDPEAAVAAFRRIESAGLKALASLDRTVHMLRSDAAPLRPATLADVSELVGRFAGTVDVDLEIEPGLAEAMPRELGATVYRVIVEALTNVRRHASGATRVGVGVRRAGESVRVCVTDDAPSSGTWALRAGGSRRGGLGLPGLAERVEALGGTFVAGPEQPAGWRVTATLPLGAEGR